MSAGEGPANMATGSWVYHRKGTGGYSSTGEGMCAPDYGHWRCLV